MPRDRLLLALAALICVILALHFAATVLHLYWILWWYDIIVHFLGGAFAGLLILWLRFFSGYFDSPRITSEAQMFYLAVVATFVIGIGWEIFERLLGHTWSVEGYWLDTFMDLLFDVAGGIVGYLFFMKRYRSTQIRNSNIEIRDKRLF